MFVFAAALILFLEMGPLKAKAAATTKAWIHEVTVFSLIFFCCGGLYPTTNIKTKTKTNTLVYQEQEICIGRLGFFFVRFCIYLHLLPSMDIFFLLLQFYKFRIQGLKAFELYISALFTKLLYNTDK
jgi:hypothetical protein